MNCYLNVIYNISFFYFFSEIRWSFEKFFLFEIAPRVYPIRVEYWFWYRTDTCAATILSSANYCNSNFFCLIFIRKIALISIVQGIDANWTCFLKIIILFVEITLILLILCIYQETLVITIAKHVIVIMDVKNRKLLPLVYLSLNFHSYYISFDLEFWNSPKKYFFTFFLLSNEYKV